MILKLKNQLIKIDVSAEREGLEMQESTETIRLDGIYKKRRTNGSSSANRRAAHPRVMSIDEKYYGN